MAEQVQAVLDSMVPSLRDLLDKGIFSEDEVKSIVTRRRESEYLLRRRSCRKSDYVRYIDAERNLEKLRSLRKKRAIAQKKAEERRKQKENPNSTEDGNTKGSTKSESSKGDASIVQLIHFIYVRAKRKWKHDLSWHLQHAEFSKEAKSFHQLGKIYAEALQIHPRNTGLWIEAASHEFFGYVANDTDGGMSGGGAIKNARVLLQRGLRINASSQELWLQSFSLEFHYIQKLRGRREILQLGLKKVVSEGDDERDSLHEDAKLPRIIYKNAIKAVPNDVEFRLQFVDSCRLFPQTDEVVTEIMASIEEDFKNLEEAWIARARHTLDSKELRSAQGFLTANVDTDISRKRKRSEGGTTKDMTMLTILDEGIKTINSAKMYLDTILFLRSYIETLSNNSFGEGASEMLKMSLSKVTVFLRKTLTKAIECDVATPEFVIASADVLIEIGYPKEAFDFITRMTNEKVDCRNNAWCWIKKAEIVERLSCLRCEEGEKWKSYKASSRILRKGLKVIPIHSGGYLLILSRFFLNLLVTSSSASQKEVSSTFEKILLLNHNKVLKESENDVCLPNVFLAYLQYNICKGDMQRARQVYKQVVFNSNFVKTSTGTIAEIEAMKVFFDASITIEKTLVNSNDLMSSKTKSNDGVIKHLYGAAIAFFQQKGQDDIASSYLKEKHAFLN